MYKPVLDEVAEQIRESKYLKPILYLITEDRDAIHALLSREDCFELMRDGACVAYRKGEKYDNLSFNFGHAPQWISKWQDHFRFIDGPQIHICLDWKLMESRPGMFKDIITNYISMLDQAGTEKALGKNLIIVSGSAPEDTIPEGYDQFVQVVDIPLIGMYEIAEMIVGFQNAALKNFPGYTKTELTVESYLQNPDPYAEFLKGMSRKQIRYVLDTLSSTEGICSVRGLSEAARKKYFTGSDKTESRLDTAAKKQIFKLKQQALSMDGTLSFINTENIVRPGGMEGLETWLLQAKKILDDPVRARKYSVKFPKGVLLAGLPGSGKSLLAKYVSTILGIPLIQFNMASVLNENVGGTEAKLDRVLKMIEASAPCVVWIDEIEKELPNKEDSGKGDSGVGKRCLAKILHWMQENKKQCFICATANHINSLPSELLRRGRFERKYYTFLPMQRQCVEILVTHLERAALDAPELFDAAITMNGKVKTEVLRSVCNTAFDQIADMKHKFFTGADLEGLVQDIKMMLFGSGESILPCSTEKLVELLVYAAAKSKPYGETNFQETVEYWCDMQRNPFLNVGVPEVVGVPQNLSNVEYLDKIYEYIPFDFTDIHFDGKTWKWRQGLKCVSQAKYDINMFNELKDPIIQQMNLRAENKQW
ncbi:hypothetical protein B5G28_04485 [Faecalibacterium sp. An77]|uniref:AAA family ATPase n=1 Tax=Faecalibacterium sp. An77 TaxID=1965655 RepID=UPI000B38DC4A|nr:AAA family ATPase [Faecalibacterium sp. An77]OUN39582.1 hypothetical protein B5G28_04485 [Faecalibacterium sp. An77]